MNKLLERQINKYITDSTTLPEEIHQLLRVISESYDHHVRERKMLERSIELTSEELIELNGQLQKEAAELRLKEKHLNTSQHIAHVGSWEYDEVTGNLQWSDETYSIFGYEPGEIPVTLEFFYSCVHPDDLEDLHNAIKKAIKTQSIYTIIHRIKNGKTVHERAEIIFDDAGSPLKMIGTVQDITERIKADQALYNAHSELKALFENMSEVFFSVDLVTNELIQMSNACEAIYGRNAEEFRKNPLLWYELVYEEDKKLIDGNYVIMNKGESFTQKYRIFHKDGILRWVESKISPTLNEDGKLIRIDGITSDITDRMEAEMEIRNSEYKFRSLIENSADAIMIVNEKSEIIFASDSYSRIMGFTPDEVIGSNSLHQIYTEDLPLLKKHLQNVLNNPEKPITIIYRRVRKDEEVIWCEGVATNLLHKPEVEGIVVNFRDITERVKKDQALRDSEHKFYSLIQNSTDAITVIDADSNIVFASDSIVKLTGFTIEEIVKSNTFDVIHPDDAPVLKSVFDKVLQNYGNTMTAEYRRLKKDGSYIWCEGTAVNLLNDPAISGVIINFRDITERKSYENALKHSEYKLRALIENSSEAIILVDEHLIITYVSDSLYRVAGYYPDDIVGLPILSLAHPDEMEMIAAFMEEVMNHPGVPKQLIYKTRKKDGSYIWCERVTINLLDDPAIKGIVSNFMDITERREQEEALVISNKELKKRNDELDRFVYSVSHDLRAPLTSILGLIEISKLCISVEEVMGNLSMVKQSVDKLDTFIQDILNYSKNTRIGVKKEKIDFEAILDDVTHHLKFLNTNVPAIELSKKINSDFDFHSDNYRITVVINNLISNAIKYSNPDISDPFISISIILYEDKAELIIKDNGIGIDEKFQPRIFEMFFRATSASVGSGLGLYIVKETLKKLDGTISFDSEPGIGTTFFITLPNLAFFNNSNTQ